MRRIAIKDTLNHMDYSSSSTQWTQDLLAKGNIQYEHISKLDIEHSKGLRSNRKYLRIYYYDTKYLNIH